MNETKSLIRGALIIALGLLVPTVFHLTSVSGSIFLPMHLPILAGAVFVNPWIALIAGALTPLTSAIATGMPPLFPIAFLMAFELAAYGWTMSWLINKRRINVYAALVVSMLVGRVVLGLAAVVTTSVFAVQLNPVMYMKGAILTGLPGMALQLLVVPVLIKALSSSLQLRRG
ncbi:ECF transporter S component [Acidaminobacter sp.]|uniref:ECF transporter S component n=1 Tax=Acidaminobacter sp. TaxID=1872102 RepID=UPI002562E81B|nr:ECF transporter S component [Acidaminobacter sp.]MDK9711981.1 ECF transporter S component [Acidaminobacter sp.]